MPDQNTTPERRIRINGSNIPPDLDADVLEVVVCQYVEGGDRFEIKVNALNSNDQQLKWIDSDQVQPGNQVEIELGYRDTTASLIDGEITALRVEYSNEQAAQLQIQGFDRLHRLRRGRRTKTYTEVKDSQVAEMVASNLGLEAEVTDSAVVHPYLLQNNLSDIDFLMQRAKRIRFEVLVTGRKLFFRPAANHLAEAVALQYMRDLKWFNVRLSTARQVSEVAVRGWNPSSKQAILGVARAGSENSRMKGASLGPQVAEEAFGAFSEVTVDVPVESQQEAEQIAAARFNDLAIELTSGEGEAVGNPALRAGATVDLRGLGTRFNGLHYIVKSEHRLSPDIGYVTRFDAQRNSS
ncbi:MAG: phage late control D family protein [Acidobacteria bacterium]|nr:phage late control D family protein [Acidobacteriota bacterium]